MLISRLKLSFRSSSASEGQISHNFHIVEMLDLFEFENRLVRELDGDTRDIRVFVFKR